jgi:hypothetical protein
MAKRDRQIYRETYYKGAAPVNVSQLPPMWTAADSRPIRATEGYLLAAGQVERADGKVLQYIELRLYGDVE